MLTEIALSAMEQAKLLGTDKCLVNGGFGHEYGRFCLKTLCYLIKIKVLYR